MPGRSRKRTRRRAVRLDHQGGTRPPAPPVAGPVLDQAREQAAQDVALGLALAMGGIEHLQIGRGAHPQHARRPGRRPDPRPSAAAAPSAPAACSQRRRESFDNAIRFPLQAARRAQRVAMRERQGASSGAPGCSPARPFAVRPAMLCDRTPPAPVDLPARLRPVARHFLNRARAQFAHDHEAALHGAGAARERGGAPRRPAPLRHSGQSARGQFRSHPAARRRDHRRARGHDLVRRRRARVVQVPDRGRRPADPARDLVLRPRHPRRPGDGRAGRKARSALRREPAGDRPGQHPPLCRCAAAHAGRLQSRGALRHRSQAARAVRRAAEPARGPRGSGRQPARASPRRAARARGGRRARSASRRRCARASVS